VAALLSSALIGNYLKQIGRKNSIVIGMAILSISTMVFGLLAFIKDPWLFFWGCMIVRFI
jgi:MFS family permease